MSWVRVDDQAPLHPKLLAAGPDALCLWLAGLCYANAHTTDGTIPKHALAALYPSDEWDKKRQRAAAAKLVAVRLWIEEPTRWAIYAYADYQEEAMRAVVEARRAQERARKAAQRRARQAEQQASSRAREGDEKTTRSLADAEQTTEKPRSRSNDSATLTRLSQPPDPALPDPALPIPNEERRARVRSALITGYQRRYERATKKMWVSHSKAAADIDVVEAWALTESDPIAAVEAMLDGVFADAWMTEKRWPWGPIAKDPAKWGTPAPKPPAEELAGAKPDAAYRESEALSRKVARDRAETSEPVPLAALLRGGVP